MAKVVVQGVRLAGVVCAVPGDPVDISVAGQAFPSDEVEQVAKTVGVRTLYRSRPGQTAGDMAVQAAEVLLDQIGWDRSSVDAVIMVTQSPDHLAPATACIAHGKLKFDSTCLAFDVNQGCSGYVYGLWMASQFISAGTCKRVLLLAGDTSTQTASPFDRSVAMLFGDAACATAIEADHSAPPMAFVLGTDGTGAHHLVVPAGGFRQRPTPETAVYVEDEQGNKRSAQNTFMDGLEIFNFTLKRVPPLVRDTLALRNWTSEQPHAFLFHQANRFLIERIAKKLTLPADQVPINIQKFGNTSMVTIPLLLADELSARVCGDEPVDLVLAAFGVGLSWAGAAITVNRLAVAQVIHV